MITMFSVEGMKCDGCAAHVQGVLAGFQGVTGVSVDRKRAWAMIAHDGQAVMPQTLIRAVESAGYHVGGSRLTAAGAAG